MFDTFHDGCTLIRPQALRLLPVRGGLIRTGPYCAQNPIPAHIKTIRPLYTSRFNRIRETECLCLLPAFTTEMSPAGSGRMIGKYVFVYDTHAANGGNRFDNIPLKNIYSRPATWQGVYGSSPHLDIVGCRVDNLRQRCT